MENALLQFSQATGIYTVMNSPWGWPFIESLHFIGLSLLLGTVGLFDLRMLGVARGISLRALHRLVPFGITGFALSAVTGSLFVVTAPVITLIGDACAYGSLVAQAFPQFVALLRATAHAFSCSP